jgi:AraC family transcriptional regulator, transcriptional activator of pobA
MKKSLPSEIKKYALDTALHQLHKESQLQSDFGMDNTTELIDGGFALYSTVNTKKNIGPIKTAYYRIAVVLSGTATFTIGLETFNPVRNSIFFGFPGQLFSLKNMSKDFLAYYMLFSEAFIAETLLFINYRNQFPFLNDTGEQCFLLNEDEGSEVKEFILRINDEVKNRKPDTSHAIRLYIQLILIKAARRYAYKIISNNGATNSGKDLFTRFLKLVSEHFLTVHKVADYAKMLHVSADHLNRIIKANSDKTAHELIDEMILMEPKAHLMHTSLSVAEIAYALKFSDPSHFNKFFKKLSECTPLQYRNMSE